LRLLLLLLRVLCRRMQLSTRWSLHRGVRWQVLLLLLLLMMRRCWSRWSSEAGEINGHRRGHFCRAAIARTTTPTTAAGVALHVQQRRTEYKAVRVCRIMVMLVVLVVIIVRLHVRMMVLFVLLLVVWVVDRRVMQMVVRLLVVLRMVVLLVVVMLMLLLSSVSLLMTGTTEQLVRRQLHQLLLLLLLQLHLLLLLLFQEWLEAIRRCRRSGGRSGWSQTR
jgi:hypothetical protein